jgi:DNA-binding response OmpR family regulator
MATAASTRLQNLSGSLETLRVLIVEEQLEVAQRIKSLLGTWGCDVEVFHTGSVAVTRAEEFQPHIALISLSLPDMRGRDVAHRLCACKGSHRLLFVTLSSEDQQLERDVVNELGFDFHLIKPVEECEFHKALMQMVQEEGLPGLSRVGTTA